MPLIILVGFPSSGKSKTAEEIKVYFESQKQKVVHIVSENNIVKKSGISKNNVYMSSPDEKSIRAQLKSDCLRLLNKTDLVIMDGVNYIKGYRYELYCASKAARSTLCTVFCTTTKESAWDFNVNRDDTSEIYTREVFDALLMRFEEPDSRNRWDSPLFSVTPEEKLNYEEIYNVLYERKPPSANQSTQNAPSQSTNYLFELDKMTQDIVAEIIQARKLGAPGPIKIKNSTDTIRISLDINASQLNKMRRQYLNFSRNHLDVTSDPKKVPTLFVQYINSVLSD